MKPIIHCPEILYSVDATLDESTSFDIVKNFSNSFPLFTYYSAEKNTLKTVLDLATTFSALHARVKVNVQGFNQTIISTIPLDVLRYKMLKNGFPYTISTAKSLYKPGYIVEGALWSNGFYHLTRQENSNQIMDLHFYVDPNTKTLNRYL
jgi:hypothetical protein